MDLGVNKQSALPGRAEGLEILGSHAVLGTNMLLPFESWKSAVFALGCFWGAERIFWELDGVMTTAAGYIAGFTPNPLYEEVCSGRTGHTEAVLVGYDPAIIDFASLLNAFWEAHDPTQGMRQGNDRGSQYRSGIYTFGAEDLEVATTSRDHYQEKLQAAGLGAITTEITEVSEFFYAEEYHQQYLHKNAGGYCGIGGTGISCA